MKQVQTFVVALALTASIVSLAGCSVGEVPSGMSESEAKAAIDKMSPQDKIKFIASSPLAGPEKEKRYAEIEKQTGVKAADVLKGANNGGPGAGAAKP